MTLQLTELAALRTLSATWRASSDTVALVPTMGALHVGHMALVAEAKKHARRVVVSIFVNPIQFGPNEDFDRYPRPLARDMEMLEAAGVDAVWLPSPQEMYPAGFASSIHVAGISNTLEAAFRPGHMEGVATVVAKLLLQVSPDVALFGEKDYQQLCLIDRMAADLNIPTRIVGVPTVREVDGLALSSRNQYLSGAEREVAVALSRVLNETVQGIRAGEAFRPLLAKASEALLSAGFTHVDYVELRAEKTLARLEAFHPPARLLAAAWLGKTRLIDNVSVE